MTEYDRLDVPELLRRLGIQAEPLGRNELVARCPNPLHDDKSPSWRIRVEPGGRRHGKHHCFVGETGVITREGVVRIDALVGRTVELLTVTDDGRLPVWKRSPVEAFGRHEVWRVDVRRNGVTKTFRTTSDHRWFVRAGEGWATKVTRDLAPGDRLRPARLPRVPTLRPSPYAVVHGFVYGDGTVCSNGGARVTLWGDKDEAVRRFMPASARPRPVKTERGVRGKEYDGLPRFFKDAPSLDESATYLYGWLSGYFAADGHVTKGGCPKLSSADKASLEFVRRLCLRVGVLTYGITKQRRRGYGSEASDIFTLVLARRTLSEDFFVIREHRRRWRRNRMKKDRFGWTVVSANPTGYLAETYCAVVEGSRAFALEDFVLTGNCWPCGFGGGPESLVARALNITHAAAREWLASGQAARPVPAEVQVIVPRPRGAVAEPPGVYVEPLDQWPDPPREYAARRGIEAWQVDKWDLGWSSEGRLAGRIYLPIHDETHALRGYTARTFIDHDRRYLEPDEKEHADRNVLFGERYWPHLSRRKGERLFVAEGALNILAVERAVPDLRPNVASLNGSYLPSSVVLKIASFGSVVVFRDDDLAGSRVVRELEEQLQRHVPVRRVGFTGDADPNSVSREDLRTMIYAVL